MIFTPNMIVLLTKGRLAGKKAVVVKVLDNNMLIVAGVGRTPVESEDYLANWEKRRNEKLLTFIKKINVKHVLATRFKADVGLNTVDTNNILESRQEKTAANIKVNEILKSALDNQKAKWLFTSLKF